MGRRRSTLRYGQELIDLIFLYSKPCTTFRTGKAVNANVVNIKAFRCEDTHSSILAYNLNQTDTSQVHTQLFTNSFHFLRINQSMTVFGSKCYRWILTFERKIEISFLLLDISFSKVNGLNETPVVNVDVTHRYRCCKSILQQLLLLYN